MTRGEERDAAGRQDHQPGGQQQQQQPQQPQPPQPPHHQQLQPQQLGDMKDTGIGQHHQHQPEEETEKDDWGTPSQPSQSTPATPPSERAGPRRGVSCNTSNLHERMPRPMIWASPGGIAPMEPSKGLDTNIDCTDKDHTMARRTTPSPAKEPEQVYPVGGDQGQQHQPQGEQEEGDHQHPNHLGQMPQGEGEREEEKSCSHSMHIRMSGSIIQASQG